MEEKVQMPRWVLVWLVMSMTIVLWDVLFVLLRPASLPGGSLAAIWAPYARYVQIDTSYGDMANDFVKAQAFMSLLEIAIGVTALFYHLKKRFFGATLLAFSASILVCAKTILIFILQAVSGLKDVGHNVLSDLLFLYVLPNSIWVVVPLIVAVKLGRMLDGNRTVLPIPEMR